MYWHTKPNWFSFNKQEILGFIILKCSIDEAYFLFFFLAVTYWNYACLLNWLLLPQRPHKQTEDFHSAPQQHKHSCTISYTLALRPSAQSWSLRGSTGLVTLWFLTFSPFAVLVWNCKAQRKVKIVFSCLFTVLAMLHKVKVDLLWFKIPSAQKVIKV